MATTLRDDTVGGSTAVSVMSFVQSEREFSHVVDIRVCFTNGVFGTTGQVVPTSGQVVESTCECSVVSTTDFYQLSGSVQLQI